MRARYARLCTTLQARGAGCHKSFIEPGGLSQARKLHRPYSLRRRVRRIPSRLSPGPSFVPRPKPRGGAALRPIVASCRRGAALSDRLFRLASGSFDAGPFWVTTSKSLGQALRAAVSELLAGVIVCPPERSPGAARGREERTLAPRRRRASDPTSMTP